MPKGIDPFDIEAILAFNSTEKAKEVRFKPKSGSEDKSEVYWPFGLSLNLEIEPNPTRPSGLSWKS